MRLVSRHARLLCQLIGVGLLSATLAWGQGVEQLLLTGRAPDAHALPQVEPLSHRALTLARLEELALSNNPTLAQVSARVQAARGEYLQVGLKPNPVVGYVANEIGNEGAAGQQGAFVSQQFITANKLGLNRRVAAKDVQRDQQLWAAQQQRVLTDVRIAFFRALVAQQRLETTRQLVELSDELVKRSDMLLESREGSRINLLQAKTEAQTIRLNQINAENQLDVAWRQLMTFVGVANLQRAPLAGDPAAAIPSLTWEGAVARLRAESPEVAVAAIGVERARWAVDRACAGRAPDITGQVAIQYDDATDDTVTSVQVGVPLQLFNRNQGNIAKAKAELRVARRNLQRVELDLANRLAAVFGAYEVARKQAEVYQTSVLPSATEALELVDAGFREGEVDYLTVLTTQRTYFQTSLAYLDTLQAVRETSAEIEGLLLTGSLKLP
ncbi:Cobalt-zinc-cadmium resistance protein CzcC precursor [Pseudobythopirellula maris]|uniref:Cobalt-zinc-cadmium resistance protein CzcC n=1 Tax=Pseudobythopirellula maris TaxID=2527991 RepID=A0A5C5ZTD1_9BACT|nr:TolC family protein [Pseudobythopirellula maris]TWT90278.1 Cobalt-zinc-cadmium resistance protein CzcC precursor [Pseudobythopirellula maris]